MTSSGQIPIRRDLHAGAIIARQQPDGSFAMPPGEGGRGEADRLTASQLLALTVGAGHLRILAAPL